MPNSRVGGGSDGSGEVRIVETPGRFEAWFHGGLQPSNNWIAVQLSADRRGNRFRNWTATLEGYTMLLGHDGIYDYFLSDVRFRIDDDAVRVSELSPVPEPAVRLQLILGFGAVGAVMRGRPGRVAESRCVAG